MSQKDSTSPRKQKLVSARRGFVLCSVREHVHVLVLLLSFLTSAGAFLGRHKDTTSQTSASRVLQMGTMGSIRPATPLYSLFGEKSPQSGSGRSRINRVSSQKQSTQTLPTKFEWEVFVDQSKSSLDKGGSATLDAFVGLAPPGTVKIQPVIISKIKSKGPLVRCVSAQNSDRNSFDVSNVDSVDKVYRILTRHMRVKGVSMKACECLKWKYKGNGHLEAGKVSLAIDAYDNALATNVSQQEGIILLMRATAYLQRAGVHKRQLKEIVNELIGMVPDMSSFRSMYEEASSHPAIGNAVFRRVMEHTATQEKQFRRTQYRHGLYQYALLQAAQDALRATQLMPTYATSWVQAGEILSELWKLKESAQYYERAIELDETLTDSLVPVIERLRKRQVLLDNAKAYGWSEDTLRLALDVAR